MEYYNNISYENLVLGYAHNYNLSEDSVTIDMVFKHWNLEKDLTKQLLDSTPQNRKKVFYEAYNTLYNELPWLVKSGSNVNFELSDQVYMQRWMSILVEIEGKNIYEIGSGNGSLITFLANKGAICIGTEISDGRPDKTPQHNLEWHGTDGVNLAEYEPKEYYDFVISDQVVEHFHPDDISTHFENVNQILKRGGKYVFYTPNYYIGPGDVSRIFGCIEAEGMHLKEYRYYEIYKLLKSAGFSKVYIPVNLNGDVKILSAFKMKMFLTLEKSLLLIKSIRLRKRIYHRLIKPFKISQEIVIAAQK
jgi:SAM-dependent methyltransferase